MVKRDRFDEPISLNVEYLDKESAETNSEALRRDLKVVKNWLN